MDPSQDLTLTVHQHGTPHTFQLPASATMQDLSAEIETILGIPTENQKLLIAPKPGLKKAPFPPTQLTTLLPLDSPKFKITLLGASAETVANLHGQSEETRRRQEARAAALANARRANKKSTPASRGGIHTLSSSSSNYTFHRLLPLSHLPNPERSLKFLERLRDDPGIRAAMAKHKFSVPLLTEMDPIEHTTSHSRTLGLNRNKGEVIELRLRTDAYDGYRDYRTIRKTLCHELAHCVFGPHDRDFWDLTAQIEREVERADWTRGGNRLTDQDFHNPQDWEHHGEEAIMDEQGWTGGEFVLGGMRMDEGGQSTGKTLSRRDIMAMAAEQRIRKENIQKGEEDDKEKQDHV